MTVRYELRGEIAIVTIDRPEVRNAVDVPEAERRAIYERRWALGILDAALAGEFDDVDGLAQVSIHASFQTPRLVSLQSLSQTSLWRFE